MTKKYGPMSPNPFPHRGWGLGTRLNCVSKNVYTRHHRLLCIDTSNSCKTLIGVHELATILLAHDPLSSLAYPVITYTPLAVGNLPIKTMVARQWPTMCNTVAFHTIIVLFVALYLYYFNQPTNLKDEGTSITYIY